MLRNKLISGFLVFLLVLGFLEGASYLLVVILRDSLQDIVTARTLASGKILQNEPRIKAGEILKDQIVLHPYFGFVRSRHFVGGEQGFFGIDILKYSTENDFNVVIVGGSVAGNFYANMKQELQQHLSKYRETQEKQINIFTFSVGGWHQPQQLISVLYFISMGARINLLINIDGYNEAAIPVGQNKFGGFSFSYPIGWPTLTEGVSGEEKRELFGWLAVSGAIKKRVAQIFDSIPLRYSVTASLMWRLIDKNIDNRMRVLVTQLEDVPDMNAFQRGYWDGQQSDQAVFEEVAQLWVRASQLMSAIQESEKGLYVHILQPNQYIEGSKPFTKTELRIAYLPEEYSSIWAR